MENYIFAKRERKKYKMRNMLFIFYREKREERKKKEQIMKIGNRERGGDIMAIAVLRGRMKEEDEN